MNDARRKAIADIRERLDAIRSDIETIASDERDAFDNMPESLQQGDRGQQSEAAADALDEAVSDLETLVAALEEATQ